MKCIFGDHYMTLAGGTYYICDHIDHDNMSIHYSAEGNHMSIKELNPLNYKGDVLIQFNDERIAWFDNHGEWKYAIDLTDQIMAMEPKQIFDMCLNMSNFS